MRKLLIFILLPFLFSCKGKAEKKGPENIPEDMQFIPSGILHARNEAGISDIAVAAFLLDRHPVTVGQFRRFVQATGYVTDAERLGDAGVLHREKKAWVLVKGANWAYPQGKEKEAARDDYPVTQVSWFDALAYCRWAGKRLPTVTEWEYAASNNGQTATRYPWGNELVENGRYQANVWQGKFPSHNTAEDGYAFTAPVGIFGKTKTGLTDMGGNVWQWTSDSIITGERLLKGGSFLCDSTICNNYEIAGFTTSSPETSLFHTGFRCAGNTGNRDYDWGIGKEPG